VQAENGRLARGDVNIACALFNARLEQLVDQNRGHTDAFSEWTLVFRDLSRMLEFEKTKAAWFPFAETLSTWHAIQISAAA
jgi:hypothetical protein